MFAFIQACVGQSGWPGDPHANVLAAAGTVCVEAAAPGLGAVPAGCACEAAALATAGTAAVATAAGVVAAATLATAGVVDAAGPPAESPAGLFEHAAINVARPARET